MTSIAQAGQTRARYEVVDALAQNASSYVVDSTANRTHRLARVPLECLPAIFFLHRHMAIELDGVCNVQPFNLPGVSKVQPVVWLLMLKAILDCLQQSHRSGQLA